MKIINKTAWRTDHLRAIIARVLEAEFDVHKRRVAEITVEYTRGRGMGYSSGHATIGGRRMTVRVPSPQQAKPDKIDFAHTVAHEAAHNRGMYHRQMRGCARWMRVANYREFYAWAAEMPLEMRPKREAPSLDERRQKKLEHAQKMLARWEVRERLAKRLVRRWRLRAKRYTRALDVAARRAPGPEAQG